jgi:hypothetical protein
LPFFCSASCSASFWVNFGLYAFSFYITVGVSSTFFSAFFSTSSSVSYFSSVSNFSGVSYFSTVYYFSFGFYCVYFFSAVFESFIKASFYPSIAALA